MEPLTWSQMWTDYSWKVLSSPLENPVKYEYGTPEIVSSIPSIDSVIPVTYNQPITVSNKNVTIYQYTNPWDLDNHYLALEKEF